MKVGTILGWLFGVVFALVGLTSIFSEPIPGVLSLLIAAILLPPINHLATQHLNITLPAKFKLPLIFGLLLLIGMATGDNMEQAPPDVQGSPTAQVASDSPVPTQTRKPTGPDGCVVPNTSISYSVLQKKSRKSDVKEITIPQCYILLSKKRPTAPELAALATELGQNNDLIEFLMFDDARAYTINKRFEEIVARGGSEDEISDADWEIWDVSFLARYFKGKTYLEHNSITFISDLYKGVPEQKINN